MATLYERYNVNADNDNGYSLHSVFWRAQTFTPLIGHRITEVHLMLRRITNPGLITVSIRGTDGAGHPAGLDLTLGTLDSGPLPSGGTCDGIFCPYPWSTIVVPAYVLLPGVQYAIVVRAPAGNALNCLCYGVDETAPTYAGGRLEHSGDSGITWGSLATVDWMFEEWGDPALPVVQTDPATEIT